MAPVPLAGAAPSRLALLLLLFAELQGGSTTKQAAPARGAPSGRETPTAAPRQAGKPATGRRRLLKPKNGLRSSDSSFGGKTNRAAEAPACRERASRLSCTGKPATKAGRFPLLGISGTLVLGSEGEKQENPEFMRIYDHLLLLADVWGASEDRG